MRIHWLDDPDGGVRIAEVGFSTENELDLRAMEQFDVLYEALSKYRESNEEYRDNWRLMGWRGMLVRVRERAERCWYSLWNAPNNIDSSQGNMTPALERKLDDAIDGINFFAFLVRAVRANNRDGTWWDGI
jgi:hypothetical protein